MLLKTLFSPCYEVWGAGNMFVLSIDQYAYEKFVENIYVQMQSRRRCERRVEEEGEARCMLNAISYWTFAIHVCMQRCDAMRWDEGGGTCRTRKNYQKLFALIDYRLFLSLQEFVSREKLLRHMVTRYLVSRASPSREIRFPSQSEPNSFLLFINYN